VGRREPDWQGDQHERPGAVAGRTPIGRSSSSTWARRSERPPQREMTRDVRVRYTPDRPRASRQPRADAS
jgi:hypothetical protein